MGINRDPRDQVGSYCSNDAAGRKKTADWTIGPGECEDGQGDAGKGPGTSYH